MNSPAAARLLLNAYLSNPLAIEKVSGFTHPLHEIDALRIGDQVFTMIDGEDEDGNPFTGYACSWGTVTGEGHRDESGHPWGHQWADTPDEARAAINAWISRIA